jgi:hypothetical protein
VTYIERLLELGTRSGTAGTEVLRRCYGPRVSTWKRDGRFGLPDRNGQPVGDGTYEIVDGNSLVVSKEFPEVTFDDAVDGDTSTFEPVIPGCTPDRFESAWRVSVADPGKTQRVSS